MTLEEHRKFLINRKFCKSIKDIQNFIPCGYYDAKKIFDEVREQTKLDGYECLNNKVIYTNKLYKYAGLSKKDVEKLANSTWFIVST